MYEIPSFGKHYFEAEALGTNALIVVGPQGLRVYDFEDVQQQVVLGQYGYNEMESFTCNEEVSSGIGSLPINCFVQRLYTSYMLVEQYHSTLA